MGGGFRGQKFKSGKSTIGPIGTKFGTRLQLIWEWTTSGTRGLGGQNVIKSLRNAMICREKMKINYIKMKCTNRHNYAGAKPGDPASTVYFALWEKNYSL